MAKKTVWGVLALLGLAGGCAPPQQAPVLAEKTSKSTLAPPLVYRVKDFNSGPGDGLPERLKPHFYLHALGSTLFLRADDGANGAALWRSDGTESGTRLVKDFTADAEDGLGDEPAVLGDAMYFFAMSGEDIGLWKMTEAAEVPALVHPLAPRGQGPTYYLRSFGNALSFVHTTAETGTEPWVSDGTAEGTHLRADVRPGPEGSEPRFFRMLGDTLTFAANDGVHGNELWRGDPREGAVLLRDIHPSGDGLRQYASNIEAAGGALYFSADDGVLGEELWWSDGTTEGTRLLKDLWPEEAPAAPRGAHQKGSPRWAARSSSARGMKPSVGSSGRRMEQARAPSGCRTCDRARRARCSGGWCR